MKFERDLIRRPDNHQVERHSEARTDHVHPDAPAFQPAFSRVVAQDPRIALEAFEEPRVSSRITDSAVLEKRRERFPNLLVCAGREYHAPAGLRQVIRRADVAHHTAMRAAVSRFEIEVIAQTGILVVSLAETVER